ncbi:MAG: class I SAM-dependent methyltransferase [Pirellulales bacterium]
MITKSPSRKSHRKQRKVIKGKRKRRGSVVNKLVERNLIHRVSYDTYREKVCEVYGGARGAMLTKFSRLSGHLPLGERLLRKRKFDLHGLECVLDVGSGAGQILGHLVKYTDPSTCITGIDISDTMLRRARRRIKSDRPALITADLAQLPFANDTFDCVTCGYVLEHLPDPRVGLAEISRVMRPGAKMLLFATEDNFGGACTSRFWACRTYNRQELQKICANVGLLLDEELWFTRVHKVFRAGGICWSLVRAA